MRASDRSGLAVMVAVALAAVTLQPLTSDGSYLLLGWLLIGVIGGAGIMLRRLRVGGGAVLATQLLVWLLGSLALGLSGPTGSGLWYVRFAGQWVDGIEHMRTQASPMEPNDGVRLIFVTAIGLIMIMTDLLVSGISRPAWALAPPATLFLVPALGLGADTGVAAFLLIATGYLGILVADGLNTTARWTRALAHDSIDGSDAAAPVVWRAAGYVGAAALAAALLLGVALPTLSLPGIGFGAGNGRGGGLQLTDPTLDLRRNLRQPADQVVIEYQTDARDGVYLRMASLPKFSAAGWTNVKIDLSPSNQLGAVPGLGVTPRGQRRTDIRVLNFASQYLPLPYAPRSYDAPGDWRYDPQSLVVLNTEERPEDLRGLQYSVVSVDVEPSAADLSDAAVGTPVDADITTEVPDDLPPRIQQLTDEVVADADTPAAKAAAIQTFLRGDEFTYSTDPRPGNGYQALENFLFVDKSGYCEQFASAMALMARLSGTPTRVAVGFLPGEQVGGTWRVTARKMHAWPELYFAGWGWVRFEPTPAVQTGEAPPWTARPEEAPTAEPTADPSAAETAAPSTSVDPRDTPAEAPVTADQTSSTSWARALLWSGTGLMLLLVLAAPATIRVRRRRHRLRPADTPEDQAEHTWAEIRDTVVDHGGRWPKGSPHAIGQQLSTRLAPEEAASMGKVATLVEQARYARALTDIQAAAQLPTNADDIRRGLAAPSGPIRRLWAVLAPRSLFPHRHRNRHQDQDQD